LQGNSFNTSEYKHKQENHTSALVSFNCLYEYITSGTHMS